MAVTFVLGRAGTGKTRHCLDAILGELGNTDDTRRLVLLVPVMRWVRNDPADVGARPLGAVDG